MLIKRNSKKSSISEAFDVLGIDSKTSKREIRNKYKELVKKFHPDINGQNTTNEEKLKDIESELQEATMGQKFDDMTRLGEEHIQTQAELTQRLEQWEV